MKRPRLLPGGDAPEEPEELEDDEGVAAWAEDAATDDTGALLLGKASADVLGSATTAGVEVSWAEVGTCDIGATGSSMDVVWTGASTGAVEESATGVDDGATGVTDGACEASVSGASGATDVAD